MKTINICLVTEDTDYAIALAKSLQHHSKYFSIQIKDTQQEVQEYDLMVTDDLNAQSERTVYLTEDPTSERSDGEAGSYIIYKYRDVAHISNLLRLAHSVHTKSEMYSDETQQVNIISCCNSCGGSGCTSVALGISQELTRFHGKKVLYLSMEEFDSTAKYFPVSTFQTNNITKLLYLILNNSNRTCIPEAYMVKDEYGVFTFIPAKGRNPLRELSGDEFIKFINFINKDKFFTDLILDCGNGLDATIISAFRVSDLICHVIGKNPDFNRCTNYLLTITNRIAATDSIQLLNVHNKYVEPEEDEETKDSETEKLRILIEEDVYSFEITNNRTYISLDKMFGQGIREIVKHVVITGK